MRNSYLCFEDWYLGKVFRKFYMLVFLPKC